MIRVARHPRLEAPILAAIGGMSARGAGFGCPPPSTGDPHFASVVLLAHGNGVDNGATFTDSSTYARSLASNNGAKTSTAQSKFNGSSGFLDGSNDYVSAAASSAFEFNGDFTVEFWARKSADGGAGYDVAATVDTSNGSGVNGWILELSSGGFIFYRGGGGVITYAGASPNDSAWHHWACCRSGSTLKLFKDGVEGASGTISGTILGSTGQFGIGGNANLTAYRFNGHWAEFRITKGVARYTANFTAPTAAFPNS